MVVCKALISEAASFNCTEIPFQRLEERMGICSLLFMLPSCIVVCNENALIYIKRLSPSFL
jgi:hypothetical protein